MNPTNLLILAALTAILTLARLVAARRHLHPRVEFANIAEGTADHGHKSYLTDAALATRYALVIAGSDVNHVAVGAANTEIPLGICTDESAAAEELVNVNVFGAVSGTQRGAAGGNIAVGDLLQSNGDGTIIKLKTTSGIWYIIGRALQAAVAGDTFEFTPSFPIQRVVP
jgi:hypothetical protein